MIIVPFFQILIRPFYPRINPYTYFGNPTIMIIIFHYFAIYYIYQNLAPKSNNYFAFYLVLVLIFI